MTEAERVRKALHQRDAAELQWALGYTRERMTGADSDTIRKYWIEIVRRIEDALAAETSGA